MSYKRVNDADYENHDWANTLFNKNPSLFLPELKVRESEAESEVEGICKIFRNYNIGPGSKVLDFSCGIGRHAIRLARRQFKVVGYDPSEYFVRIAKSRAMKELELDGVGIKFYSGKVSEVQKVLRTKENQFDAILIMFNSIGYTTNEDDINMLRNLSGLASRNTIMIIEMENRDWRLKNFLPYVNYSYPGLNVYESWTFDLKTSIAKSVSTYIKKGSEKNSLKLVLTLPTHLRLYSLHEFVSILDEASWSYKESFGSVRTLQEPSLDSPNIVSVSKKHSK